MRKNKLKLVKTIVLINKENGDITKIILSELIPVYMNLTDPMYKKLIVKSPTSRDTGSSTCPLYDDFLKHFKGMSDSQMIAST